jgi:multiple sugar transport system permease protein
MARRRIGARIGLFACHAVLMAGAVVMVAPMLWMFVTAFKTQAEIAIWPPVFLPQHWTLENFTGAFRTAPFGRFFLNSLMIAVITTLSVMLTSLVASNGMPPQTSSYSTMPRA